MRRFCCERRRGLRKGRLALGEDAWEEGKGDGGVHDRAVLDKSLRRYGFPGLRSLFITRGWKGDAAAVLYLTTRHPFWSIPCVYQIASALLP